MNMPPSPPPRSLRLLRLSLELPEAEIMAFVASSYGTMSNEEQAILWRSLAKIPEIYREPLVLYYYEDMVYKQISEIMHIPVSTAAIRLKRGKVSLQKIYQSLNLKP